MFRETVNILLAVLLAINKSYVFILNRPNDAEEDFTSFRKLNGRILCPPSVNNGFAFSRSRFSSSVGHLQIHSSNLIDSVCCLAVKGCGVGSPPVG